MTKTLTEEQELGPHIEESSSPFGSLRILVEEEQELEPQIKEDIRALAVPYGKLLTYNMGLAYELFNASSKGGLEVALWKIHRVAANSYSTGVKGKENGKDVIKVEVKKGRSVSLMSLDPDRVKHVLDAISESTFRAIVKQFTAFITVQITREKFFFEKKGDKNASNTSE